MRGRPPSEARRLVLLSLLIILTLLLLRLFLVHQGRCSGLIFDSFPVASAETKDPDLFVIGVSATMQQGARPMRDQHGLQEWAGTGTEGSDCRLCTFTNSSMQ